jgi:hypothetical protein
MEDFGLAPPVPAVTTLSGNRPEGNMAIDPENWLDRLENGCGPVLAWGVAVAAVVTVLPMVLLWELLRNEGGGRASFRSGGQIYSTRGELTQA